MNQKKKKKKQFKMFSNTDCENMNMLPVIDL